MIFTVCYYYVFRKPVLMANADIHEAEIEARNHRMKQVIELYEDGDNAWKVERDALRQANADLAETNDKLRKDLAEMEKHREVLAMPLRRQVAQLKVEIQCRQTLLYLHIFGIMLTLKHLAKNFIIV